jgi:hypothetical protein
MSGQGIGPVVVNDVTARIDIVPIEIRRSDNRLALLE